MVEDKITGIEYEMDMLQQDKRIKAKTILKSVLAISPLLLSIIGSAAFNNHEIFIVGSFISGGEIIIGETIKIINEIIKNKNNQAHNFNNIEASSFYTDEYKEYYSVTNNLENQKYQRVVENQQRTTRDKFKIHMGYKSLSKEDVMFKIINDLDVYSKVYKIPPINVSNEEWDRLFDEIYEMYDESFKISFYTIMLRLVKFTLASVLLDNKNEININTFIDNIENVVNIRQDDLRDLRNEVLSVNNQKVIKFKIAK